MHPKKEFYFLFSYHDFYINQHYPFFHILAMVSSINQKLARITIFIIILLFASGFASRACSSHPPNYVRVAIMQDVETLSLKILGSYEIIDSGTKKVLYSGRDLKTTVTAYKNGILFKNIKSDTSRLLIKTDEPGEIIIDDRRFRGEIQLVKKSNLRLLVINYIELEDYIKGILYHEASHYWPMEALKAQAIACRTYALNQMQENKLKDYDVTSDIYSQVYGGRTSERYRTNEAVSQTKGQVLTYQGRIFPAYYHATCGGYTEDASLLWDIDIPPLKGVSCGFCKDSPHLNWHYVLSLEEIGDKLTRAGFKIRDIKEITVLGKDKSGRITDLRIRSDKKDIKISSKDFRNIIGPNIIRSTNFNLNIIDHDVVFEGSGWGHGAGLCQWGSYFMAKKGYSVYQILKYYYPQSDVETIEF